MRRYILFTMILFCASINNIKAQNYVKTILPTIESTSVSKLTADNSISTYQYFDDLGRPFQAVFVGASQDKCDLATYQEYDNCGREDNVWLPVVAPAGNNGETIPLSTIKALSLSTYGDAKAYAKPIYRTSPLKIISEQYGPGQDWHDNNKGVKTEYLTNTADGNLACKRFCTTDIRDNVELCIESEKLHYLPYKLNVIRTTDEDGQGVTLTFKNPQGQVLLIRQMNEIENNDTYYVYDAYGNLKIVLPPLAADNYETAGRWSEDTELNNTLVRYAYLYKYDNRNRMIAKKLPGAGWIKYKYDKADRMIFSQDAEQANRGLNEWTFYLYDKYNRLAVKGECRNPEDPSNKVIFADTQYNQTTVEDTGYWINTSPLSSMKIHLVNYYDDYTFSAKKGFNNNNFPAATHSAKGMLTASITTVLDSTTKLYSSNYYNEKGRLIKIVASNHLGGYDTTTISYTFTGQLKTVQTVHTAPSKVTQTQLYTYTYDHAERLTMVKYKLNTNTAITLADYAYDNLGRLQNKRVHDSMYTNGSTYTYNVRSWLTGIIGTNFTQYLYYNTGDGIPQYNGNVSSMTWRAGADIARGYNFTYDKLCRLTSATYRQGTTFSEINDSHTYNDSVSYDKHGNITHQIREGQRFGLHYNGNQIIATDNSIFSHNKNGAMTKDSGKGIASISYNSLNLPEKVAWSANKYTEYLYDAFGRKLQTMHVNNTDTLITDYCGSVIYENGSLKRIINEEGYVTLSGTTPSYYYYLKDHLGNNRMVVHNYGTPQQVNHYYPFGGTFHSSGGNVQPYKLGAKELDSNTLWHDFEARHYDDRLGRFTTMDPMAEKYYSISPYAYCANNPMRYVDPDGRDWYSFKKDKEEEEQNRIQYKYIEGTMSNEETITGGYTHLGKTHLTGNTYYSLGGSEIKFDLLDVQGMTAMSIIKDADKSLLATIDAIEGVGDFWDKYSGVISTGSDIASVLNKYMETSKGVNRAVTGAGFVIGFLNAKPDAQALWNRNLKGMDLVDAAMNIVSLAGTPGAAISLSYTGSKEVAKGIDFIKKGSEVGVKKYINSIFSWMGTNQLIK